MNEKQVELIKKIDPDFFIPDNLSMLSIQHLEKLGDQVSDYFQNHGIDADNEVNEIGLVCESIMDIIGDL